VLCGNDYAEGMKLDLHARFFCILIK